MLEGRRRPLPEKLHSRDLAQKILPLPGKHIASGVLASLNSASLIMASNSSRSEVNAMSIASSALSLSLSSTTWDPRLVKVPNADFIHLEHKLSTASWVSDCEVSWPSRNVRTDCKHHASGGTTQTCSSSV